MSYRKEENCDHKQQMVVLAGERKDQYCCFCKKLMFSWHLQKPEKIYFEIIGNSQEVQ